MKPELIATEKFPIRCSSLPYLLLCPNMFYMRWELEHSGTKGEAGEAAQTGNLVHVGIQAWHGNKSKIQATDAMKRAKTIYPLGNITDAIYLLERYIERETARPMLGNVIATELEHKSKFQTEYGETEKKKGMKSGTVIWFQGTMDMVRYYYDVSRSMPTFVLIDHKTGQSSGQDMIYQYYAQLAGYTVLLDDMIKQNDKRLNLSSLDKFKPGMSYVIHPAITRIRALSRSNLQFQFPLPFNQHGAKRVMQAITHRIEILRTGHKSAHPGKQCDWCESKWPECELNEHQRISLAVLPTATAQKKQLKSVTELFTG